MNEDQIELYVERQTDRIDRAYLRGELTDEQYEQRMRELAQWADAQS